MKKTSLLAKTAIVAGMTMTLTACTGGEVNINVQPINTIDEGQTSNVDNTDTTGSDTDANQTTDDDQNIDTDNKEEVSDYVDVLYNIANYAITQEESADFEIPGGVFEIVAYSDEPLEELRYSIGDYSGDGNSELAIMCSEDDGVHYYMRIIAMYEMTDDGVTCLFEGSARDRYYLIGDNKFENLGSGGADSSSIGIFTLEGTDIVYEERLYTEYDEGTETIVVYSNNTGLYTYDESEISGMSYDDFMERYTSFAEDVKYIGGTPLYAAALLDEKIAEIIDPIPYAKWAYEVENDNVDFTELVIDEGKSASRIAIGINPYYVTSYDIFKIKNLTFTGDSVSYDKEYIETLDGANTFIIQYNVVGDFPQYGFSFVSDEKGKEYNYAIEISGENGLPCCISLD